MNLLRAAILAALIVAAPVDAEIRIDLAQNASGSSCGDVFTTNYKDGSCPQSGAACTVLTCSTKGDATATFDEDDVTSSTIDMTAAGSNDNGNFGYAYKNFTSGDIQATGCFPATSSWSGNLETFAGPGVGIAETTGDSSWFFQCWIPYTGTIRQKYGTPPDNWVGESGPAQDAPVCLRALYESSTTTLSCAYASSVGGTWTQFATSQTRTMPSTAIGYTFLTSHEVTASTSLQATDVTVVNTSGGDPDPPPGGGGTCDAPLASPNNATYNTGIDMVADVDCRNDDDIVAGWDWSLPFDTSVESQSGLFFQGGEPAEYYKGNELFLCNLRWKDLEPTDDNFDWSTANACMNIGGNYDGLYVNVRATVREVDDCNGNPINLSWWTAPSWMQFGTDVTESCHNNGFRITHVDLDNANVRAELVEFIDAFAAQGFHENAFFKFQIIHAASSSGGEECCAQTPGSLPTFEAMIQAWVDGYGIHAHKLGWLKEDPFSLYDLSVNQGGTGVRGGVIERWGRTQYTPGDSDLTGQLLDANGHLTIDPTYLPISENRHWADQMEEIGAKGFTANVAQNHRMAALRSIQMRRNSLWVEADQDPRIDDWMSLQMGKSASEVSEGWTVLMRTWTRTGGANRALNNFERHIGQRESFGATTPVLNNDHGYNIAGNPNLPSSLWNIDRGRTGTHIGFFVEDSFWPVALTQDCLFKVVYQDSGTGSFTIEHDGGTETVTLANSGAIRTATRFVTSCSFDAAGTGEDFYISSGGSVPFLMVRLIKEGNGFPTW